VLYRQGDPAESLYYLESGLMKLTRTLEDGREVLIRFVREGEVFGERALISDDMRDCTAHVIETSAVGEFTRRDFLEQCSKHQDLWYWFTEMFTRRLKETERRNQLVSFYRVEYRILQTLADLAVWFAPGNEVASGTLIPLTQSELADLVGASRETTSTTLNVLRRKGLVLLGRRYVTVVSAQSLRVAAKRISKHG